MIRILLRDQVGSRVWLIQGGPIGASQKSRKHRGFQHRRLNIGDWFNMFQKTQKVNPEVTQR